MYFFQLSKEKTITGRTSIRCWTMHSKARLEFAFPMPQQKKNRSIQKIARNRYKKKEKAKKKG